MARIVCKKHPEAGIIQTIRNGIVQKVWWKTADNGDDYVVKEETTYSENEDDSTYECAICHVPIKK